MIIDYDYLSKEFAKCWKDKSRIYMIQHYLKTFDNTQRAMVPFMLFPRQQDICRTLGNALNVVTTKPRQAGITTTAAAFIACQIALANPESPETVLIVGRDLKLSQNLLEKIEHFLTQLPRWFWGDEFFSVDEKSDKNKKDIFAIRNRQTVRSARRKPCCR